MQKIKPDFVQDSCINSHEDSDDYPLDEYQDFIDQSNDQSIQVKQKLRRQKQTQNSTDLINRQVKKKENFQTEEYQYTLKEEEEQKNEQVETKNLPAYLGRLIYNAIGRQNCLKKGITKNIKFVIKKYEKCKFKNLKQLREFIEIKQIAKFAKTYISSNRILKDIICPDKQKNIGVPIKYLKKLYLGCKDPNNLYSWK